LEYGRVYDDISEPHDVVEEEKIFFGLLAASLKRGNPA
jgi:hypothetical protein